MAIDWRDYIAVDSGICHGKPCVKGSRVLVSTVLDNLAAGLPHEEIIETYPALTEESIRATIAYAADLARDRVITYS